MALYIVCVCIYLFIIQESNNKNIVFQEMTYINSRFLQSYFIILITLENLHKIAPS